jgi:phosphate transport system permease protein
MGAKVDVAKAMLSLSALVVGATILLIVSFIFWTATPIFQKEGLSFITGMEWSYSDGRYGILIFIANTLILTMATMLMAIPLSILTAIYLGEFAPVWLKGILRPMIELLVGIPSVVYGIFGLFILSDIYALYVDPLISSTLGFIPVFHDPNPGRSMGVLLASSVLAIMVLPTITVLSEEAIRSVPREYKEASYALGATRWDTILKTILPVAFPGMLTAIVLGMMRAMGETMAVVMLLGNSPKIPSSIMDTGYAMTSKILNDIGYYIAVDEARSALFGIAAVLFIIEAFFVYIIRIFGKRAVER